MSTLLRNHWYVALESTELDTQLFARTILNEPVVFFRLQNGSVAALRDRCPHRSLPLSMGKIVAGHVQCGYHGLTFDGQGTCVKALTQDRAPASARVQSYPVVEKDGFIWIWPGDPDAADPDLLPDFKPAGRDLGVRANPAYRSQFGYKYVRGNYQLLIDNLLDLTHAGIVHSTTLGNEEFARAFAEGVQKDLGNILSDYREARSIAPPASFSEFSLPGMAFDRVDMWNENHLFVPSTLMLIIGVTPVGGKREQGVEGHGFNILTPETESTTHYYYGMTTSMPDPMGTLFTDTLMSASDTAFEEDRIIIEAQQLQLDDFDPDRDQTVSLIADKAAAMARRKLRALNRQDMKQTG